MGKKIEELLLLSRWLQAPMLLGLIVILVLFEIAFAIEIIDSIASLERLDKKTIILLTLDSIDMVLIANLIIMVLINTHDIFIRPIGNADRPELPSWIGNLDSNQLKLKIIGTILLISAIHLLHMFFDEGAVSTEELIKGAVIQFMFILTAIFFLFLSIKDKS